MQRYHRTSRFPAPPPPPHRLNWRGDHFNYNYPANIHYVDTSKEEHQDGEQESSGPATFTTTSSQVHVSTSGWRRFGLISLRNRGLHCFTDATSDTLHRIGSLRPFPYYSNSRLRGVVWPDQFTPTIQSANTLNCMHQKHAIHPFTIPSAIHAYGHPLRHQQFTLMTFTRLRSSSSTTYDPSRLSPASASYPTIYGGVSSAPRVRATTMEDQAPDSAGDRC